MPGGRFAPLPPCQLCHCPQLADHYVLQYILYYLKFIIDSTRLLVVSVRDATINTTQNVSDVSTNQEKLPAAPNNQPERQQTVASNVIGHAVCQKLAEEHKIFFCKSWSSQTFSIISPPCLRRITSATNTTSPHKELYWGAISLLPVQIKCVLRNLRVVSILGRGSFCG